MALNGSSRHDRTSYCISILAKKRRNKKIKICHRVKPADPSQLITTTTPANIHSFLLLPMKKLAVVLTPHQYNLGRRTSLLHRRLVSQQSVSAVYPSLVVLPQLPSSRSCWEWQLYSCWMSLVLPLRSCPLNIQHWISYVVLCRTLTINLLLSTVTYG